MGLLLKKFVLARKLASVGLGEYSLVGKREKLTIKNGTQKVTSNVKSNKMKINFRFRWKILDK